MQLDLFADQPVDTSTPFTDRVVCIVGTFRLPQKQLIKRITEMGGDCKATTKVSRNVHYVLMGENAPMEQCEALRTLNFNGYQPRVLGQTELDEILAGRYDAYRVPQTITKDLHLNLQHYLALHPTLDNQSNMLYTRELYVAPDTLTPQMELYQQLGNRGIYANPYIDDTTDYIVISDASLARLQRGETDETLRYIEEQYNASRSPAYRYVMLSESEVKQML